MPENCSGLPSSGSYNFSSCFKGVVVVSVTKAALLLSLCTVVLYLGLRQWRRQRSFAAASHSDIFTYHVAVFEIIWFLAISFNVFYVPVPTPFSQTVLFFILFMPWYGETFFHVLTCVERYLAVVHPIVYMRLRNARGVRIRNISIICVWILSPVCSGLNVLYLDSLLLLSSLIPFGLCLVIVSFCSLSVLYVLIHPGPGDGVQEDQTKRRVFFTITVITVVLWMWFGGTFTSLILGMTSLVSYDNRCAVTLVTYIFNLPSSVVLPLLYLHRAGKLAFSLTP